MIKQVPPGQMLTRFSCDARAANGRASRLTGGRISGTARRAAYDGRDGFYSMSYENVCVHVWQSFVTFVNIGNWAKKNMWSRRGVQLTPANIC